jgi:hypothetical protein
VITALAGAPPTVPAARLVFEAAADLVVNPEQSHLEGVGDARH